VSVSRECLSSQDNSCGDAQHCISHLVTWCPSVANLCLGACAADWAFSTFVTSDRRSSFFVVNVSVHFFKHLAISRWSARGGLADLHSSHVRLKLQLFCD